MITNLEALKSCYSIKDFSSLIAVVLFKNYILYPYLKWFAYKGIVSCRNNWEFFSLVLHVEIPSNHSPSNTNTEHRSSNVQKIRSVSGQTFFCNLLTTWISISHLKIFSFETPMSGNRHSVTARLKTKTIRICLFDNEYDFSNIWTT